MVGQDGRTNRDRVALTGRPAPPDRPGAGDPSGDSGFASAKRVWAVVLVAAIAAAALAPSLHAAARPTDPGIAAAFGHESYPAGSLASLKLFGGGRSLSIQIFHAGIERGRTSRKDVMSGMPVSSELHLGNRRPGSLVGVRIGHWPSDLYFAQLSGRSGRKGYAPFVLRPSTLGDHRVAIVIPTQTWQAYNFRDDDGDGRPDTWYADPRRPHARMARPFLDRGVPPHYRHYDLPFLHWVARTGKAADYLSDADLARATAAELAAAYDLIVFPGHHEYVTTHEYEAIAGYRDRGGNLMFLSANNFFWQIVREGDLMTRTHRWRDLGRPESQLIGVQYRANDRGERKGPWIIRRTAAIKWLLAGTDLRPGSRIGSGGIEIDSTSRASPAGLQILAEIPNLYAPGFTAMMTFYRTTNGAKVFAAGAFDLVESILEPDKPLPDPRADKAQRDARHMLENLWTQLSQP